ncbi:putative disease resistance protein At3g14460 [Zingiber officinale]|uniref:putative disease resistance protein At3g14460 n=1 Tax=Zingiber officinale TaxID=94328 RepID=UPI001C4BDE82|nr:putative disease resistance protein At3g14460 [Zingiber officinale]
MALALDCYCLLLQLFWLADLKEEQGSAAALFCHQMEVALTVGGWFAQAFIQTLVNKASDPAIKLFAEGQGFKEDLDKLRISLLETQIILDAVQTNRSNNTEWKTLMQELKDAAYDAEDLIDEFQYHVRRRKIKGEEEDKASGSGGLSNFLSASKENLLGSSHSLDQDDMRARVRKIQGRLEGIANRMQSIMNVLPPNDRGKQPEVKFQARESCSSPVTDKLFGRDKELNQVVEWLLGVSRVEPILLDGLEGYFFCELFKKCSFGTLNPEDYPELEDIGRKIARKLKGSPLAAKTVGRYFAFCSLFPKDYRFDKDELVRMWMAEGFIEDKHTKRMEDVGSNYFLEFVNRSFFQEFSYYGSYLFVMHDLIHDLAEMIVEEETYRIKSNERTKILSTIRHLRVAERILPLEFSGYGKLRTLVLRNSPPDSLFEMLRSIRVLDVSRCGLQELSEHIDGKFLVLMKDVRRLTNLQELPIFSVQEDDGLKLGQLKDLTQLHGTLGIYNLQNSVDSKEANRAELKNKVHLKELRLEWNHENKKDAKLQEEVIEGLQPHESLKILRIREYNGAKSPSWLMPKFLSNLEKLELEFCMGWDDVLPFIGQRLHLIELRLFFMPALKQLSHEFEGKCFPKLEVLHLCHLGGLKEWSWIQSKDLFPCLRILCVRGCPKLKRLPPFPLSLETLIIDNCPSLKLNSQAEDDEDGGCHLPTSVKVLFLTNCGEYANLLPDCLHSLRLVTRLTISHCPHITSIPPVQLVELQYLYISNCDELRRMECLGLLKSLKELKIEGCPELSLMDRLGLLKSLNELKIVGCPKLAQLDVEDEQAGSLSSLRKLCVDNTALLKMFPLRNALSFITELTIQSCSEEVIFEEAIFMQSLTALTSLSFGYCEKLQYLPTELLHCLPSLEELIIYRCPQLQSLPKKGLLPFLRMLKIYTCPQIQSLPEEGLPPFLEELHISQCPRMQAKPVEELPKSLDVFHCSTLDAHPTLKEQIEKFYADKYRRARLELE